VSRPKIDLFGKPGCSLCEAAAGKLKLLGLEFSKHEIAQYIEHHEGWKNDGSIAISSAYFMHGQTLPIIRIDGEYYTYAMAMRRLRREKT